MTGQVKLDEVKDLIKGQSEEIKGAVAAVKKAHEELDGRVAKINEELEAKGKEFSETKEAFQKTVEKVAKAEDVLDDLVEKFAQMPGKLQQVKSLGQACAESEAAKNYQGGNVVLAKHDGPLFAKAVTSDPASAGVLVEPHRVDGILAEPDQPLTIRDLLTVLPLASNAIEWVQEKLFTNAAAPQASEGAAKAQSDITFEKKSSTVQTLAHWMPVSRQVLADAKALRAFIDMRLRQGLKLKEEEQLLFGDGTGGNLLGLYPQATAYDTSLTKSGYTNVDQIRKAILQVALAKYPANAVLMNPADWADIELLKTADNAYLFSNPSATTVPRLWGKRVVESMSLTAGDGTTGGQFMVGAFGLAATLWDREETTVRVAEQHGTFFVENMVAVLCEERLALTVERPAALVKGNLVVA